MEEKRTIGPVTSAAAGGGLLAGSAALLIAWAFTAATGIEFPPGGEGALATLLGAAGALLGGWLVKPGNGSRAER